MYTYTLTLAYTCIYTHTHGQITLYLFVHRSTYKERGVDVIARTAYMLKHVTEKNTSYLYSIICDSLYENTQPRAKL